MIDTNASIDDLRAIWESGPSMHKRASDLERYEILFERIRPQVLVETGLYYGGSAHWFAARVPHVVTVEIDAIAIRDYSDDKWGFGPPPTNATVVEGDSLAVYEHVAGLVREWPGPVMVVLDSDHSTETVYGEATAYSRLVTSGSYLVIEDGILHYLPKGPRMEGNWYDGDPLIAAVQFLAEHPDFSVDSELEDRFPTTQHPHGWLRRR